MAQGPLNYVANNGNSAVPLQVDPLTGALITGSSSLSNNNVTTSTVIKGTAGRLAKISVITAGSTAGTANDCKTVGAVTANNTIMTIPNTVGLYAVDWPCQNGITVVPGTGQVLSVAYR